MALLRPGGTLTYSVCTLAAEETVGIDAWLADEKQPPPLRRLILEGRDGIARALRARERDGAADANQ